MNIPLKGMIRVIRIPAGEDPEWVRKAWVGLALPLSAEYDEGYAVKYDEALQIFRSANPEAAARLERGNSEIEALLMQGSRDNIMFVFKREDVEVIVKIELPIPIRMQPGILEMGIGAHDNPAN